MGENSGSREYVGGLVVGISTVITGHPFDIVKIYRRAGLEGCYAGLGPTMVRAFPAKAAAAIVTWEPAIKVSDD